MKVLKMSVAGSMESNDAMILVEPCDSTEIIVESVVKAQYGERIEEAVLSTVSSLGIEGAKITVKDKGALECTLKARTETALLRSVEANS